jgi:hypothetical protein
MKGIGKYASLFVTVLALVGLMFLSVPNATAQQDGPPSTGDADDNFNPPPCDYNDQFYNDNGIDYTQLIGRFGDNNGTTRLTGPPAKGKQVNYVADSTCSVKDPNRRNFRILATTGGNSDDNNSPFTCTFQGGVNGGPNCVNQSILEPETFEFISILAFVDSQNAFTGNGTNTNTYSRDVGFINGGLEGVQQNPGTDISIGASVNIGGQTVNEALGQTLRGFAMQDIVSNFEAYAFLNQFSPSGVFESGPCSNAMMQEFFGAGAVAPTPCFPVNDTVVNGQVLSDVATPNLQQNWRFAANRNSIDGSDNNAFSCPDSNPADCTTVHNSPFGYFCDDLLGMWIITYLWFNQPPSLSQITNPTPTQINCNSVFQAIGAKNGFRADGFPIVLTAFETNVELEGNGCSAEAQQNSQEDMGENDGGAIWLICPTIPDPRAGAITTDAFLDQVSLPNGFPENIPMLVNFLSLQIFGVFANEITSSQMKTVMKEVNSIKAVN